MIIHRLSSGFSEVCRDPLAQIGDAMGTRCGPSLVEATR